MLKLAKLSLVLTLLVSWKLVSPVSADPLAIVYANKWAPLSVGDGESVSGILPTLLNTIIAKEIGQPVRHLGVPWKRAQSMMRSGQADAFITTPTATRLKFTERSKNPIYSLAFRAFVHKENTTITQRQGDTNHAVLRTLKVCDVLGNGWVETFYVPNNIPFQFVPIIDNCLKMVARGTMDVVIHPTAVTLKAVVRLKLANEVIMLPKTYPSPQFAFMISKKSPFYGKFLTVFDDTVTAMKKDGTFNQLITRLNTPSAN
jgi:polar amino acid transport system substrate-binding protein